MLNAPVLIYVQQQRLFSKKIICRSHLKNNKSATVINSFPSIIFTTNRTVKGQANKPLPYLEQGNGLFFRRNIICDFSWLSQWKELSRTLC